MTPSEVLSLLKDFLLENKSTLCINGVEEASEDFSVNLKAPYLCIYTDFNEDCELASSGKIIDLPIEVKILVFSNQAKTAAITFENAFSITHKLINLFPKVITNTTNRAYISFRDKPIEILVKKKEQSVIQLNLFYNMSIV